jgi:CRISPR-associated endonuclease Cas1
MNMDDTLYGRIKNGVLTLSGNNASIRVDGGCLVVSDGPTAVDAKHEGKAPPVEKRMTTLRFRRADCPVSRIVVTRPDGFITFGAIKWLHGAGVSLVQLDWDGTVLLSTGVSGTDYAAMRRAQALAPSTTAGLALVREIIRTKLRGQAEVAQLLGGDETTALITRYSGELDAAMDAAQVLTIEATAAAAYWRLWQELPVYFARRQQVPEHWQSFGTRYSPISRSPRNATTPGTAILNYLYGVLASEMTIALISVGLDLSIGVFHTDKVSRPSLTYDAMEVVRPYVDAWLAAWLRAARFSKRDFYEETDGTIRITRPLTSHLAMTAPLWRQAAGAVAQWLAQCLTPHGASDALQLKAAPKPLPAYVAPTRLYTSPTRAVIPRLCPECGNAVPHGFRKYCSTTCADSFFAATMVVKNLNSLSDFERSERRINQLTAGARQRAEKNRRHLMLSREWEARHSNNQGPRSSPPNSIAASVTDDQRDWFVNELVPRLALRRSTEIQRAAGLSPRYAIMIRQGHMPHPRHFAKLAELCGVKLLSGLAIGGVKA